MNNNPGSVNLKCSACKQRIKTNASKMMLTIEEDGKLRASYICPNSACPSGGGVIVVEIEEDSAKILKEKGVHIDDQRKEELPPIEYDDILDFHLYLNKNKIQKEPWFKELVPKIQNVLARRSKEP